MALVYRRQIAYGAVGIQVGLKLLRRLEDNRFTVMFNVVLTFLTVRLVWQGEVDG